jgi:CRISPR-associated protein Csb2
MSLVLEIEHLLGIAFAAENQASDAPQWPPQPDRVFSALAATWGARGEQGQERRALEWLEAQPHPEIAASTGFTRTAPVVFVPPNDPESHKVTEKTIMPGLRRRQARRFPAFRPDNPIVLMIWRDTAPDAPTLAALNALASDTAYVGHSASLTRCRFQDCQAPVGGAPPRRRVYRGRLAELERGFHARPLRRPSPGAPVTATRSAVGPVAAGVFSDRWLVLEHVEGDMPDIRAVALVAKELRNALMSGYRDTGLGAAIPETVSGHSSDGRPASEPHLAIVPLAFLGSPFASGAVFGVALISPRQRDLLADPGFQRALRAVTPWNERAGRRQLSLDRLHLAFSLGGGAERRSLDPLRYVAAARLWASCTPIILDRHLKENGNEARQAEIERLVCQACANVGLPEPKRVVAGKHSAVEGSPSAYPSGGAPGWTRWRLPESLASRQLVHALIEFVEPVQGPVILGAGRFVGLGLCMPREAERRQ